MKRLLLSLACAAGLASSVSAQAPTDATDTDVSARSKALEVAGAFSNDGYKIRDGYWAGEVDSSKPQLLEVNLFAGNEYWFTAAATPPARRLAVTVYDEAGEPVDFQTYNDGPAAAAGFVPEKSGRYFLKLSLVEGEKAPFCLIYSYK